MIILKCKWAFCCQVLLTKHPETRGSPYLLLYVIENENIIIILTFSLGQVETMRKQNSLKLTVI